MCPPYGVGNWEAKEQRGVGNIQKVVGYVTNFPHGVENFVLLLQYDSRSKPTSARLEREQLLRIRI